MYLSEQFDLWKCAPAHGESEACYYETCSFYLLSADRISDVL
jgi:hypothetical protein